MKNLCIKCEKYIFTYYVNNKNGEDYAKCT